jgi:hypothetical protein
VFACGAGIELGGRHVKWRLKIRGESLGTFQRLVWFEPFFVPVV